MKWPVWVGIKWRVGLVTLLALSGGWVYWRSPDLALMSLVVMVMTVFMILFVISIESSNLSMSQVLDKANTTAWVLAPNLHPEAVRGVYSVLCAKLRQEVTVHIVAVDLDAQAHQMLAFLIASNPQKLYVDKATRVPGYYAILIDNVQGYFLCRRTTADNPRFTCGFTYGFSKVWDSFFEMFLHHVPASSAFYRPTRARVRSS